MIVSSRGKGFLRKKVYINVPTELYSQKEDETKINKVSFVVCLSVCHFVLVFFSPFSIAITSLGEERANLSAFRTFARFVLV